MRYILNILILLPVLSHGQQNLVPNGGFEQYTVFMADENPVSISHPWESTGAVCTPDYFNVHCPPRIFGQELDVFCSVPVNNRGYQYARTGSGYAGIHAFSVNESNGREFIQIELVEPIHASVRYEVSFHVSLADKYRFAVSTIGAHFSETRIERISYTIDNLGLVPLIQSPFDVLLDDKENWTEVRDTFSSRYGNERFLIIGNFNLDEESGVTAVDSTGRNHAYYYIDDVSVVALDSIPNSVTEVEELNFSVHPNPAKEMLHIQAQRPMERLQLFDLSGRAVLAEQVLSDRHSLNLSGIPPGIYLLEVSDRHGGRSVQKVVLQ